MYLPRIVEYLLALRRPNGSPLVSFSTWQEWTWNMPPSYQVTWEARPNVNNYAAIEFQWALDHRMVPDTLLWTLHQAGHTVIDTIVDSWVISEGIGLWVVYTRNSPVLHRVVNYSNLNQFFRTNEAFLTCQSVEDYKEVLKAIDHMNNSPYITSRDVTRQILHAAERAGG